MTGRTRGRPVVMSAAEAVEFIDDGAALTVEGSGGGLLEPTALLVALERRYLDTGSPSGLTLVHCTGIGDRNGGGIDRLAHEGLVKRAIGGHWGMAPAMCALATADKIEAYNLPQGVMSQQYREIAGGRPGVITHVGLGTFCDPRLEGGKLNAITTDDIVDVITLGGREWLHYHRFPIDVSFIRATTADELGNLTLEHEGAKLEALAVAQATRACGGLVIAQVKRMAQAESLPARDVVVPGILVDAIVVDTDQRQTVEGDYEPAFSGEVRMPLSDIPPLALDERKIIARRAALQLRSHDVVNLGVGMADGVASVAAEEGVLGDITLTVEQGVVGGVPARGVIFGVAYNPQAILDQPSQFDFYDGGGLDAAFLGFAQVDRHGNVNVSRFGNVLTGTGGFVNISQNARTVVFCGTFTAGGLKIDIDGGIRVAEEGRHGKFLHEVEQITFSAEQALRGGQRVLYVTERAVFELTDTGLRVVELAPGIDLEDDVLAHMEFMPQFDTPRPMPAVLFREALMGLVLTEDGAQTTNLDEDGEQS